MALGNRRSSVGIAAEASFGSLTAGIPAASGLSYVMMEVLRASISYSGQVEPSIPRDLARNGTGRHPPETEAPFVGSTKQRRRYGEITINGYWRCNGSTAQASTANHLMLNTVMTRPTARGADAKDTIDDVSPAAYECQVTTPGAAQIGELIAFEIDGKLEVVRVTGTNSGAGPLTWSPNLSSAPANGATYRYLNTYFPTLGDLTFATFKSAALRVDLHGKRFYATGCRLKSLVLDTGSTDERTIKYTAVFMAAAIYDDDGSASPENPTVPTGGYAKFLDTVGATYTPDIMAEAAPANSGGLMTNTVLPARRWSMEFTWALLKFPETDPAAVFDDSRRLAEQRMWTVPNAASGFTAGNGMAVQMSAGFMPDFVEPQITDTNRYQNLVIEDGPYAGDVGTEVQSGAVRKSCCLGTVA